MTEIISPLLFKDARRLRILLCGWGVVLVFKSFLYVGGAHLFSSSLEYQMMLPFFYRAIDFLEKVLMIVLIPMCLQEDPCVGTTAFWFSRPLSRRSVLATKGLFLSILLVGIPTVIEMTMLAWSGVPAQYVMLSFPEIILERLAFIILFVLLASITGRFSEYAKVGAIILGVWIVWSIVGGIIAMISPELGRSLFYGGKDWEKMGKSLVDSIGLVNSIFTILCFTVLVIHQHLTRYTARTVRWAVVAYLLVMMIGRAWEWDFLKPAIQVDKEITINRGGITTSFDASHMFIADSERKTGPTKIVRSRFVISGTPVQYYAMPDTKSTIQMWYEDGTKLESWGVEFRSMFASLMDDALLPALQNALGDAVIRNSWKSKFIYNDIFELGKDDFDKFKNKSGTYAADMKIDFFDYQISSVLPLRQGAAGNQGKQQIKIFGLEQKKADLSVLIMERNANILFDRAGQKKSIYNIYANGYIGEIYVLRNPKAKEVVFPVMGSQPEVMSAGMGDFMNEGIRLQLNAKKIDFNFNDAGIESVSSWLKDAELVRLEPRLRATVDKDVRIENFAIPAVSTDPDPSQHNPVMSYGRGSYRHDYGGRSWRDTPEQEGSDNKSGFRVESINKATFSPTAPLKQGDKILLKFENMKNDEAFDFVKCGPQCTTAKTLHSWNGIDSANKAVEINVTEDGEYYFWIRRTTASGETGPVFIESSKDINDSFNVVFRSGTSINVKIIRDGE